MKATTSKNILITAAEGVIYRANQLKSIVEGGAKRATGLVDGVVEYPGSKKGDFGHWVLMEWVDQKIKTLVERNGRERR